VIPLSVHPDGTNINQNCGSVHPEEMRAAVIKNKATLGIAFDGDGDRIVMADENGVLLDGNAILALLGVDLLERDLLPHKTLVATVVANVGLEHALAPYGGKVIRTKVGDRHVVEPMREHGYILGGESSGHIIMLEHNTTGDAMLAALHLLATMLRRDQPLSLLLKAYQPLPEAHAKVPLNGKRPSEEMLAAILQEAEAEIKDNGKVIIRPSGTEPLIRIMVQHDSLRKAQSLVKQLADKVSILCS
jgi:phosphoglucosamine mutase